MTPVFGHGHLRLYLLSLLAERPQHGYELIQSLEERFGGTYTPSAGTIYPRLAKLEEEGLVSKAADGRKTIYEITDAGRAEVAARASELDGIESELTDSVRRLADEVRSSVSEAMKSLRADLAAATREARSASASAVKTTGLGARERLRDVEILLTEFRHEVRSDLRGRAARGTLSAETVAALREGLDALRRSL